MQTRKRRRNSTTVAEKKHKPTKLTVPVLKEMIRDEHTEALKEAIAFNQTASARRRAKSARSLSGLVNVANKTSLLEALNITEVKPPAYWSKADPDKRFELQEVVGRGSFGSVYKAVDRADGQTYALKILSENDKETKREVAVLKRFATATGFCHRNVICYHDMFEITVRGKRQQAIQMEFIEGLTLDEWHDWWFSRHTTPPPAHVARKLATDLFSAVAAIHEHRIYHLDIKPTNVMLRRQGQDAVLVDFGISCSENAEFLDPDSCFDATGGTISYMSPGYKENCDGKHFRKACDEEVRRYTDIWATGLTLWNVLQPGDAVKKMFDVFQGDGGSEKDVPEWLRELSRGWQRSTMYPLDKSVDRAIRLALNTEKSKTTTAAELLKIVQ